jgi:outer membrane lipoprotein-sorting protein
MRRRRFGYLRAAVIVLAQLLPFTPTTSFAVDDILARARATYASLRSYADTGSVEIEFGPVGGTLKERHTFSTSYRSPRYFYFDFTKHQKADRIVVWSDETAFHTWWQTTGVETTFPKGQGSTAFVTATPLTKNSVTQIAPLLFPQAGLTGTLTEFGDATVSGTESVGGRKCHKLVGIARSVYGATQHVVNVRKTSVWIDAETFLVRKIVEDAPRGTPTGMVMRVTTTFQPQANPKLEDRQFVFVPPSVQEE